MVRVVQGRINTEYGVRIADGSELCAVVSTPGSRRRVLETGEQVWAVFNDSAVVLHAD